MKCQFFFKYIKGSPEWEMWVKLMSFSTVSRLQFIERVVQLGSNVRGIVCLLVDTSIIVKRNINKLVELLT